MLVMNDDYLITMLIVLCKRFSIDPLKGRHRVAELSGLSEQYIYQIISGKPMQSGQKRSIGKLARGKLTQAFPDWLDPQNQSPSSVRDIAAPPYTATPEPARPLVQIICTIAEKMSDDDLRELIGYANCLVKSSGRVKAKPKLSA
jgi:transcriptional regulator with XRE-family HTH domain